MLSVTPIAGFENAEWMTVSSATPEGRALIEQLGLDFYATISTPTSETGIVDGAVRAAPTDPYFPDQWHLFNVGQIVNVGRPDGEQALFGVPGEDINVIPVWEDGITGEGVFVAVVDTGVQLDHPDLLENISLAFAFNALSPGATAGPGSNTAVAAHGTSVAGLIGAVNDNGIGVVGVAHGSTLVPIKLLPTTFADPSLTSEAVQRAIAAEGNPIDIFNHSWGPSDETRVVDGPDAQTLVTLISSATEARGGLGAIHVFAAGNGGGNQDSPGFQDIGIWDSAGSDGFASSRYTIGVGIVDHDGRIGSTANSDGSFTLYGEAGPSVLIVAPSASGPFDILANLSTGSGIFTTDLTGDDGANIATLPNGVSLDTDRFEDTDYTTRFGGTSAAAPIVSGVIALMLEANPNLSYRDVEEILVRSARQTDQFDDSWTTNLHPLFRDLFPSGIFPYELRETRDLWVDEIRYLVGPIVQVFEEDGVTPLLDELTGETIWITDPELGEDDETEVVINPNDVAYNPILTPRTQPPPLPLYTNGAGFTVSHGRTFQFSTEYGYAHGVIDADLAVKLAKEWHNTDQQRATELSWLSIPVTGTLNLPGAEITNMASGRFVIPGGYGGLPGYVDYFNEFFEEPDILDGEAADPDADPPVEATPDILDPETGPFSQPPGMQPGNSRGIPLVFAGPGVDPATGFDNTMAVEWVEVKLDISGEANALDYLRITLVSPSGVQSELTLNQYMEAHIPRSFQYKPVQLHVDPPGSLDSNLDENDTFSWIYTTNRNWGERSDGAWQIHFENYSETGLAIDGLQVAFHGNPIGNGLEPVERVWGTVGVDAGRDVPGYGLIGFDDGYFNFDRYIELVDPFTMEVVNRVVDVTQEPFAGNITVVATDDATGLVVAQFITGADGNYYFDLPEGSYTINIEDPLGRELKDDTDYQSEWHVDVEPTIASVIGFWSDEQIVVDSQTPGINFLLDPGDMPINEVVFEGQVFADLDGSGTQDPEDIGVSDFLVFADLNHTGLFESGEPFTVSGSGGNYSLPVTTTTFNTFTIGAEPIEGWTKTFPASGVQIQFAEPGETIGGLDFGFAPPTTPTGEGDGRIFGLVFDDLTGDGVQQSFEAGMPGVTVFIDAGDKNGILDMGEVSTVANETGAYVFENVSPGSARVDVVIALPLALTAPAVGYRDVTVSAGGVVQGVDFGVENLAVNDFGDLFGAGYRSTLDLDGPRHTVVEGFSLGSRVDAELDSNIIDDFETLTIDASRHGIGDDIVGDEDDEDGVVLAGGMLRPGGNTLNVTLNGVGGYFQGWIDFDNSGTFDAGERVFADEDLNPGTHQLLVVAPITLAEGQVAARFRWGTIGKDYFGADTIGEVEDYLFDTDLSQLVFPVGDFNHDLVVDQADYDLWKATFGSTVDLRADANENGTVDAGDYSLWRDHLGESLLGSGSGALATADGGEVGSASVVQSAAALSQELSYAAWQARIAEASKVSPEYIAWIESIGGQVVTVDGPNGPTLRFSYTAPDSSAVSSTSTLTGPPTGGASQQQPVVASRGLAAFSFSSTVSLQLTESPVLHSLAADTVTDSDLLLLDQVLSEMAPTYEDDQGIDPLAVTTSGEDEEGEFQLALAEVFDEEIDWRFGG